VFEQLLMFISLFLVLGIFYLFFSPSSPLAKKVVIEFPYERRDRLMTEAEGSFFQVLELALPEGEYRIFGKVRVEDLISVKPGLDRSARQSFRNRIKSRHIDIVVVDRKTFRLVWAIELDDKSHDTARRKERDEFLDKAFQGAGVPLIRFKAKRGYTVSEVRSALGLDRIIESGGVQELPVVALNAEDGKDRVCPRCYAPMVKKRIRSGKRAGQEVLACSRYPKCRQLLPVSTLI